ncbi:MAG: hypothetical protein SWK76_12560 [Actinomycetota bacterium]|nr:hypothetical protein [Actinomycetota bacterium]
MEAQPIDLTAIIVAIISATSTIISAIIVARGQRRKKEDGSTIYYAGDFLLIFAIAILAWRLLKLEASALGAAAVAMAGLCTGSLNPGGKGNEWDTAAGGKGPRIIYYISAIILVASFVVITARNPELITAVSLICVVLGVGFITFSIYQGSMGFLFKTLISAGTILFVGSIAAVMTLVVLPGPEEDVSRPGGTAEPSPESPQVEITITMPENGEVMGEECQVNGTSRNVPEGQEIGVVICCDGGYEPFSHGFLADINSNGEWSCTIDKELIMEYVGAGTMFSNEFEIRAVLADKGESPSVDSDTYDSVVVTFEEPRYDDDIPYPSPDDIDEEGPS